MRRPPYATLLVLALMVEGTALAATGPIACLKQSGKTGTGCLRDYMSAVSACRLDGDSACEAAVRADGGALDAILARAEQESVEKCSDASGEALGYLGTADVALRVPEACADFSEDLLGIEFGDSASGAVLGCRSTVVHALDRLRLAVVHTFGRDCYLARYSGGTCNRAKRDRAVERARSRVMARIRRRCGDAVDGAGLAALVAQRARHFAQRVYPPNDLGPTADFGPFPIGVRTLELVDPSRMNAQGTGPRPLTVEVYYPSTAAAVDGVPRDVVRVLGVDIVATPAYRDVALAAGTFPLVLFSHGNGGIRFQSFFFAAHLASHGFVVATPDHHGNTFIDALLGVVDPLSAVNRPLDLRFLLDQLEAFTAEPGNFFANAIDPARVGVSGHSFGGYTAFAIAGGTFGLGTFTDARVKAILPQAPSAFAFLDAFFATIPIPTLIVGGSIDETTPFAEDQQRPFDHLPAGAAVVGLAELVDAGHFTFSDFCEVERDLLAFLGGFDEACEPRHLPWRHAHDIVNFLSLNFFDGVLNGNAAALARLAPASLAQIEDLVYQSK